MTSRDVFIVTGNIASFGGDYMIFLPAFLDIIMPGQTVSFLVELDFSIFCRDSRVTKYVLSSGCF